MAQVPKFPSNLFFFCDIPSTDGGETPIVLSNVVYEQVNSEMPEFVADLKQKEVKYTRIIPEEDDSQSAIGTIINLEEKLKLTASRNCFYFYIIRSRLEIDLSD